nr:hypothetical protein [uncultured Eisenbergiella sp.]
MKAKIITYPGNRSIDEQDKREKRRKKKTKSKDAMITPMHNGNKGIKSGKSYSACRLI